MKKPALLLCLSLSACGVVPIELPDLSVNGPPPVNGTPPDTAPQETVEPLPPASTFLASNYDGTEYKSRQRGNEKGRYNPPDNFSEETLQTTYAVKRVSDTQIKIMYFDGIAQSFLVDVHEDGTLTIPDQETGQWSRFRCDLVFFIGKGEKTGSGTWDYKGNLMLSWSSRVTEVCSTPIQSPVPYSYTYEYREHRITAVRNPKAVYPYQ